MKVGSEGTEKIIEAQGAASTVTSSDGSDDALLPGGNIPVESAGHEIPRRSKAAATVQQYLFDEGEGRHTRWAELVAVAAITTLAAWIALGQLDALLRGMHLTNQASYGVGSLSGIAELGLSEKPAYVTDVVSTWLAYSAGVGSQYASALDVVRQYLLIDTFVLIPSYATLIAVLLLRARLVSPPALTGRPQRSYELLIAAGLSTVGIVVIADVVENVSTLAVVDQVWGGGSASTWPVRLMWAGSLVRTIGLVLLAVGAVVILALRRQRFGRVLQSLVAVRGELLVIGVVAVAFVTMPQIADVVRRWNVSVVLLTTSFAIALALLVHWTSWRTLAGLQRSTERVTAGETLVPAVATVPGIDRPLSLRVLAVVAVFVGFTVQLLFTFVLDAPAGLRLGIPVALIVTLWMFGVPLPRAEFERGVRVISDATRRKLPRFLGAVVFIVLGATVMKAGVPQLVFAEHADWWLLFTLLPLLVGLYRLHTKTGPTMGRLEALIVLGVALIGGWLIVAGDNPELSPVALTVAGLMMLYGAMPFYYSYDATSAPSNFTRTRMQSIRVRPMLAVGVTLAAVTAVLLIVFPLELAPAIGTVGVVLVGAMLFAAAAAALVGFAEWTRPPDILYAFRIRRTPVFILLAVWLVLAGGSDNDITVIAAEPGAQGGITIDDVWSRWLEGNPSTAVSVPNAVDRPAVPIVFVASSGGGIRAAAWTGYVMDCIFGLGAAADCGVGGAAGTESIVAMSGVSGGSLGLASFAGASLEAESQSGDWVKARLGDDYLAAAVAWLAFVDTPQTFLGFVPSVEDRAAMMERAFERSWQSADDEGFLSRGIFDLWYNEPGLPAMIFNGTSVNDPCRFNASVIDSNAHQPTDTCTSLTVFEDSTSGVEQSAMLAATQDLVDYLCPGQDVKVSTAAVLSARFPVISPSGRVGGGLDECEDSPRDTYVVDGGYLEGSGAGTAMEVWNHLETRITAWNADQDRTCIVPFFLQIDNGYENPAPASGRRPRELLAVLSAVMNSSFGRIANAREQAAIEFNLPLVSGGGHITVRSGGDLIESRYARLVTSAHPGVQAPLGWTLSTASFDDLRNQLQLEKSQRELAEVGSWLDGHLTCTSGVSP